jgi:hypothetical protein
MKKITLSQNLNVLIDDEDFDKVKDYHWHLKKSTNRFYARTFIKNAERKTKKQSLMLQHLIVGKAPQGQRLFFKDGNSLNCQKSNLVFISPSEASHTFYKKVQKNKNSKGLFKGVMVQYVARIKYKNKIITLGYFTNEEDAAKAYNNKVNELYGENAKLNFL